MPLHAQWFVAPNFFSGYYGCDKCCQQGEFVGRMTYPLCEAPFRTDTDFRLQSNSKHHNGVSPFCSLPVDMIKFFPIDWMHQVCLGVMKRLLLCWTSGSKQVKLSATQKLEVNARLQSFRSVVLAEFNRKPGLSLKFHIGKQLNSALFFCILAISC